MTTELPSEIVPLIEDLSRSAGAVAVVLGGSRANATADATSDWDLGVYYRGTLDLEPLERWGEVFAPGQWGRLMNGGAWLEIPRATPLSVDVILRDLDVVEFWSDAAARGDFEVDGLLGYLAGMPTYTLLGERSVGRVLWGELPTPPPFPDRLAETAPPNWRFRSRFSIEQARMRAKRGDVLGTAGQLARAVIEEAHARLCEQRTWALNEKRIVEHAGLSEASLAFGRMPSEPRALTDWADGVAAILD